MIKFNSNKLSFSAVFGGFFGYCINVLIEITATIQYLTVVLTSASLYIGLCFYTKMMTDDLKAQLEDNLPELGNNIAVRMILIREIQFHYKITR